MILGDLYDPLVLLIFKYLVASNPCSTANEAAIPFKDHLERPFRNIYVFAANNLFLGFINFGKILYLVPVKMKLLIFITYQSKTFSRVKCSWDAGKFDSCFVRSCSKFKWESSLKVSFLVKIRPDAHGVIQIQICWMTTSTLLVSRALK